MRIVDMYLYDKVYIFVVFSINVNTTFLSNLHRQENLIQIVPNISYRCETKTNVIFSEAELILYSQIDKFSVYKV